MIATAVIAYLVAGPVPGILTSSDPRQMIRWPALSLHDEPGAGADRAAQFLVAGPAVLRFEAGGRACDVRVSRVARTGSATLALPLAPSSNGVVVVPPQVAPPAALGLEDAEPVELEYRVEKTSTCAPGRLHGYRAESRVDAFGGIAAERELRSLFAAVPSPEESLGWLSAPFPHRWQESAALLAAVSPWLGVAADDQALRAALAVLRREANGARDAGLEFTFIADLRLPLPSAKLGAEADTYFLLPAGKPVELEVDARRVLHLVQRASLEPSDDGMAAWRLLVEGDGARPNVVLSVSPRDPLSSGYSRQRTEVLAFAPGARRVRLTAQDRTLALRGLWVRPKAAIEEAFDRDEHQVGAKTTSDPAPPRLRDIVIAATTPKASDVEAEAEAWLGEWQQPALAPLARVLSARLVRARIATRLLGRDYRDARRLLLGLAKTDSLRDEDAVLLAKLDVVVGDSARTGLSALEQIDHMLAMRPMDQSLLSARALAFSAYSQWRSLPATDQPDEVAFLNEPEASPSGSSPSRTRFLALSTREPANLLLPMAAAPERHPVLTFLGSANGQQGVAKLLLDGKDSIALPLRLAFERYDLPLPPGAHTVALQSSPPGSRVFVNLAPTAAPTARLRTMVALPPGGQSFLRHEVGQPGIGVLTVRAVGDGPLPAEIELLLEGNGAPVRLPWRPGPAVAASLAEAAPGTKVTAELEVTFPLRAEAHTLRVSLPRSGSAGQSPAEPSRLGARILVSLGERQRRSVIAPVAHARAASEKAPVLDRISVLRDLGEIALAREALLAALASASLGSHERAQLDRVWRELDEASGPHPASAKPGATLSPWLLLTGEGDLARLSAARTAEIAGDYPAAKQRWLELAAAHPQEGLLRREAGRLFLAEPDADPARAYVELVAALPNDPCPDWARTLLRRATGRTRVRFLPYAEDSAGTARVEMAHSELFDDLVPSMYLPAENSARGANLLSKEREATLTFALSAPTQITLRVSPQELRLLQAKVQSPPVALEWVLDGGATRRLPCAVGQTCTGPDLHLGPGNHVLKARVSGGLRPLARLWVMADRQVGNGLAMGHGRFAIPIDYTTEYLVARADRPVRIALQGPTVLRVDARTTTADRARWLHVRQDDDKAAGAHDADAAVELVKKSDGTAALADGAALSAGSVALVALNQRRVYRLRIRPDKGAALVRLSVRDNDEALPRDVPVPTSYPSPPDETVGRVADLQSGVRPTLLDPPVALGWDDLGTLGAALAIERIRENGEGEAVQKTDRERLLLSYRRLVDSVHTTIRLQGAFNRSAEGGPSQSLGLRAFFMHPDFRFLRALCNVEGYSQEVSGERAWAGKLDAMIEPVATLLSGLHLVTKLGYLRAAHTLGAPSSALLATIDPSVYSRYSDTHWQAAFVDAGLETEPFVNLVLYGNARLTTNPEILSPRPDHATASLMARAIFGRTYVELMHRFGRYFADANRDMAYSRNTAYLDTSYSLWPSLRQRLDVGATLSWQFETRVAQGAVFIAWEGSNGRRFRDHTPVEGEDYFFPQRGPGRESGDIRGTLP